jgi:hypothetical protein
VTRSPRAAEHLGRARLGGARSCNGSKQSSLFRNATIRDFNQGKTDVILFKRTAMIYRRGHGPSAKAPKR